MLISSVEELKKGIEHLKNNNLGRASFYLNQNGNGNIGFFGKLQKYFSSQTKKEN
ncbi:MAG: hypothetical protein MZV64_06135 [Ignavibacteriales bacterium]|nr:hypothetical protein [Ignavibacteriales bacterium]